MGQDGNILIVEDQSDWASLFKKWLRNDGFTQVVIAYNQEQALKILVQHNYDLVILDLNLLKSAQNWDDYEGIVIVKEMSRWPTKSRPAVIIVSGYLNQDAENFLNQHDAIAILRKDKIEKSYFLQAVHDGMGLRGK